MKSINKIATLFILVLFSPLPILSHNLKAEYVPWGIDEYELFGMTKKQLTSNFKNKLHFNNDFSCAYMYEKNGYGYGPHFILTFDKGKVVEVQREFIDGFGCHIEGPVLDSKAEALRFTINGISSLSQGRGADENKKLEMAKAQLKELESSAKTEKAQK